MSVIETERLLFRDHEPGDLIPFCEMESDPEYRRPQVVHPRAERDPVVPPVLDTKPLRDLAASF